MNYRGFIDIWILGGQVKEIYYMAKIQVRHIENGICLPSEMKHPLEIYWNRC